MKYTSALKPKLIYVMRINDPAHEGCLKVGEATSDTENIWGLEPNSKDLNKAAKARINDYTQTAGIDYELLYTEISLYVNNGVLDAFTDSEVHNVLERSGIKKKIFNIEKKANEWFETDLETVKNAITAVKKGRASLQASEITTTQNPIVFRPEQKEAITKTKRQFKRSNEMLWFAKMRFGKTLSALQVIKEHEFGRSLILTHRPVVDKGWFEDFGKVFYDKPEYIYCSKKHGEICNSLEEHQREGKIKYVYFVSMQDLRGSEIVGGNFNKNDEIFSNQWDLIIIDEAHEGTQTELGKNVINELKKNDTKILHLSGTPFNLLDNYKEDEIYTWDYVMEQKAKADWDKVHFGDPNPYSSLPKLNIFTYDISKLVAGFIDEELAFNFKEFFRVDENGGFIHHKDVFLFLNLICKQDEESNYPYSTEKYRDNFRHSLWMVPGVKEARALSVMLKKHPVFGQFSIVNVAGDGDEEEETEEALKKVEKAITDKPNETYTITLSCGRLTTGVSVKAWTAVFMLSGSCNTTASTYMQTIFRVQTPATINGKVKEECFVFDFAPDRTLKVIAETAKISAKAGKTSGEDRTIMGEFLNFCPIISVHGSQMLSYDVNGMLEQLKKVYVERVVRNGFEDGYLYNNDQLMKLELVELEEFNGLKKIIGSTKSMPKSGDIDINKQGFTDEEYKKLEASKKKRDSELSEEEKNLLAEKKEKKKNRDSAISILRGISIRMPLLIYGAVVTNEEEEITIDNFTDLVDDQSWTEFMPKGVDKPTFLKFKKYYEPDVFRAAGKRIRALARAADKLSIEERIERITSIFSTFRNPDKETVLTPWRVVNLHLGNCLGGYVFLDEQQEKTINEPHYISHGEITDDVYSSNAKILEINSKSGLYPLFVTYSIYCKRVKEEYPKRESNTLTINEQRELWDKTVAGNIFVICKTPMAKSITKRTLVGFRDVKVNTRYFEDLIHQISDRTDKFIEKIKKGKSYWNANEEEDMKFNAIVGNPPYQETTDTNFSKPIYHLFFEAAKSLSPDYLSLIHPARFLFNAGATPKEWNNKMLNDPHLSISLYESNSQNIFPSVDIKGGVCVTFWNKNKTNGGLGGTFIANAVLRDILKKVKVGGFDKIVGSRGGTRAKRFLDSYNRPRSYFPSSIFTTNQEQFSEKKDKTHQTKLIGLINNRRIERYVNEDLIDDSDLIKWKLFIPKSNGSGALGETLSTPQVGSPQTGCTESFIQIGPFESQTEAENCLKYIKTKLCRALLGTLKVTQDNPKSVWKNVPLQDFSQKSDIDWNKSIQDIDSQLYSKYDLEQKEIDFIEKMIKPMEG